MPRVLSAQTLANGLKTGFEDTYTATRVTQSNSVLGQVMDLTPQATNRVHEFAYYNAAPHMEFWERGQTIPGKINGPSLRRDESGAVARINGDRRNGVSSIGLASRGD